MAFLQQHEQKATAMGVYNFLRFTGASIGPLIGGLIAEVFGYGGLFASLGIIMIIAAVVIKKYIYDPYEIGSEKTA